VDTVRIGLHRGVYVVIDDQQGGRAARDGAQPSGHFDHFMPGPILHAQLEVTEPLGNGGFCAARVACDGVGEDKVESERVGHG